MWIRDRYSVLGLLEAMDKILGMPPDLHQREDHPALYLVVDSAHEGIRSKQHQRVPWVASTNLQICSARHLASISLPIGVFGRSPGTVSYTHLDVYKRQVLERLLSASLLWTV